VIGDHAALFEFCKRPAFVAQIGDDLVARLEDEQRTGIAARRQAVGGGIAPGSVAGQGHAAEGEDRARLDAHIDRHRTAARKVRGRRQLVEIDAVDGDGDDTAIAGFFVEQGDQPVAVVARLDDDAKIARDGLVLVLNQMRGLFQRLLQILVRPRRLQRHGIGHGIDDVDRLLFLTPQGDAEQLERIGVADQDRAQQRSRRNRQGSCRFPIRKTQFRVTQDNRHTRFFVDKTSMTAKALHCR